MSESGVPQAGSNVAMRLLAAGVPLSLLIDLTSPDGPDSRFIHATEQPDPIRWCAG
ncbi:MAG TPA: hypothetical protein VME70_13610 [Mycobacteriales bacterium]|nr:hypothetical protein [Mycobacteriales bacterium]